MSFGLRESRRRGQRRRWIRLWIGVAIVVALGLYGVFAYEVGINYADARSADLSQKVADYSDRVAKLQRTTQDAQVDAETSRDRLKELSARYDRDIPQGPAKDLFALVQQRLKSGISPERLSFVIGTVENARNCEKPPLSRRIVVKVPNAPANTNASAGFGDWGLSVAGAGVAGKDAAGEAATWFDPAQPVTLTFLDTAGHSVAVPGKLPFTHTIITGNAEHHFTMTNGPRGLLVIAAERCRYP